MPADSPMKCSQCGEANPVEAPECGACGAPLLDVLAESSGTRSDASGLSATLKASDPTLSGSGPTSAGAPPTSATPAETAQATGSIIGGTVATAPPAPAAPLIPNGTIVGGRYEVLSLLGQGGMGQVYAARDRELDKVIALKTIRGETGDPMALQRFKQELLLARKVTHKNVVRIYDLGEAEGIKFFTMEHIEGKSLKALIRDGRGLAPDQAVSLAREILGGLEEAHSQGVVHRDLKPQNVMVDTSGHAHLMDFGIARSVDAGASITGTGAIVGTPDYMSPEQVKGEKADERSDVYSFGVILYEMLAGDVPFQGDTPLSKIVMRLSHTPRAPHEIKPGIPDYLESVVRRCMEVDAGARYQKVAEILADIERREVGAAAPTVVVPQPRATIPVGWVAVATVAVVLSVAGWWVATRRPGGTSDGPPAGPVRTLAIVPFTNATGSAELEWMRTGLPEMLVTDLSQSAFIRPVPGERVHRVLEESGLAQQSRFDEKALESVARLTKAESVLSGQFVESGGRLRLDLTLRKTGSGVPIPLKIEGAPGEVFALVDTLTRRVKENLDLAPDQIKGDTDRPITEVSTSSLEAQLAYQRGLAELRKGARLDAITHLQKATSLDAGFAMAYAKLAEAQIGAGLYDEAAAAIDRAKALSEKAPLPVAERYQIHATAALAKDDFETAAKAYQELARLYPDDPDIQMSLARVLEESGKMAEALEVYRKVVAAEPKLGAALLGLGRTQVVTGHADDAIRSLKDALATKQFEGEPEALGMIHSILGVAYRDTGQLDLALETLGRCLDYREQAGDKKGQAVALANLASVYEHRGELDRAIAAEKKSLALARELRDAAEESAALNSLGLTYTVAGRLDKALEAFRQSFRIETERQDHRALANRLNKIANIYRLMGQYDDALVYLEQAKTHLAQSHEAEEQAINLHYIAQVRQAQGLYDQARDAFLAALPLFKQIEQDMGVAMVHHDLAEIYAAQGRYADAHAALVQSLELYTHLGVAHDIAEVRAPLGHLLASIGQVDAAGKELAAAEKISKEIKAEGILPEILLGRAEVAHLQGRHEEAARLFEEANVKANLSGQKQVAVESRIELGHLYLEQGRIANAERLLLKTRAEAAQARLRPLEAAAASALARVYLAKKDPEAARKQALDASRIAEKLQARPVLFEVHATLAESLEQLGRAEEALDAWAKAATTLEWLRGSLRPEDVAVFMGRRETQAFLKAALPRLRKGGRTADAAALEKWAKS